MRTNLVNMLDCIGLARALGIKSSAALFGDSSKFMHSTSAIRFPVFVSGKDFTGSSPSIVETPLLRAQILGRFREEMQAVRDALIIPLGDRVTDALLLLVSGGRVC